MDGRQDQLTVSWGNTNSAMQADTSAMPDDGVAMGYPKIMQKNIGTGGVPPSSVIVASKHNARITMPVQVRRRPKLGCPARQVALLGADSVV